MRAATLFAVCLLALTACRGSEEAVPETLQPRIELAILGGKLVRLDTRTLDPVGKERVELRSHTWPWALSPQRSAIALGGRRSIRVVNVRRMEVVADLPKPAGFVEALAWPARARLVALAGHGRREEVRLAVIDLTGRVRFEQRVAAWQGWPHHAVATAKGIAALVWPVKGIGPTRLLHYDVGGRLRVLSLERIHSGSVWGEAAPGLDATRELWPGLAVDREGARAYVVGAGDTVAEVDLEDFRIAYHELREERSLLRRLRDWLEPVSEAKTSAWTQLGALWLGGGRLAVFGRRTVPYLDARGGVHERGEALGLRLVDTRTWTVRTVDASADWAQRAGKLLLATAYLWDSAAQEYRGIGLRAYTLDGEPRFHALGARAFQWLSVVGAHAYVPHDDSRPFSVVDLRTGRVVRESDRRPPVLLGTSG